MILQGFWHYSPKLLGNRNEKWWMVIKCSTGIAKYYRHLFYLSRYRCEKLMRGSWEEHITVIRNEEPFNKELWEKYEGKPVQFEVIHEPRTNGDYHWLPVICPLALDVREELGLPRETRYNLHLSFGHKWE